MKKKVVIFSSTGGGGHISASKALRIILEADYDVKIVYPFLDILYPVDFIRVFTGNRYNAESLYNLLLTRKHLLFLINIIYHFGKNYIKLRKYSIQNLFNKFIQLEQPDLIISVIPLINGEILSAITSTNIPLLVIPTDLDVTTFLQGINNPIYKNFHIGLAFSLPEILKTLKSQCIASNFFSVIGFPLRSDFFEIHNKSEIKKKFNIPEHKQVVLCMLGAAGSESLVQFIKQMKEIESSCHLIVCLGRSENLKNEIQKIELPPQMSFTILGFTEKMSELMAISDLFVTKSGTVSVCEALYMNLPLLLDATGTILAWEQFNHTFVVEHGFGDILHNKNEISQKIDIFLKNAEKLGQCRENMKVFQKKALNKDIQFLVQNMLIKKVI